MINIICNQFTNLILSQPPDSLIKSQMPIEPRCLNLAFKWGQLWASPSNPPAWSCAAKRTLVRGNFGQGGALYGWVACKSYSKSYYPGKRDLKQSWMYWGEQGLTKPSDKIFLQKPLKELHMRTFLENVVAPSCNDLEEDLTTSLNKNL